MKNTIFIPIDPNVELPTAGEGKPYFVCYNGHGSNYDGEIDTLFDDDIIGWKDLIKYWLKPVQIVSAHMQSNDLEIRTGTIGIVDGKPVTAEDVWTNREGRGILAQVNDIETPTYNCETADQLRNWIKGMTDEV